jgi:DNA-binding response OmpR family regulator
MFPRVGRAQSGCAGGQGPLGKGGSPGGLPEARGTQPRASRHQGAPTPKIGDAMSTTTHPTTSCHIRIVLADEDETTRVFLQDNLTADGYHVTTVTDLDDALHHLRAAGVDLILVDVNGHTLRLIDWVRGADPALCAIASDTPVIILTSHPDEIHRVRLLERGGDDVIAKPFSYPELRARISAILRRTAPRQPQPVLTAGPLRLDPHRRTVTVDDRVVDLSAIEYRLLHTLASEPTRVLTKVNFELPEPKGA